MLSPELKAKAQEFIKFFEEIPEEKWYAGGKYINPNDSKCKCAMGHLGMTDTEKWKENREKIIEKTRSLKEIFTAVSRTPKYGESLLTVIDINDNEGGEYAQFGSTPKQRILKVLNEAIEL